MRRAFLIPLLLAAGCPGGGKKTVTSPTSQPVADEPDAGEEDPGDGVAVEGLLGTLSQSQIEPVLDKESARLAACYADNVGGLKYVSGQIQLKFRVAADGSVKRVQLAEGDLGSWAIEKCLLKIARTMTFPKPRGGEAEFSFPIEFPAARSVEVLPPEEAGAELEPVLGQLDDCVESGMQPSAVRVTVYVGPGGKVTSAGFATAAEEPFTDEWADCAQRSAMRWKLTDPRGRIVRLTSVYAQ
jgi:hypothetical protein